jgi:hypothetical protein
MGKRRGYDQEAPVKKRKLSSDGLQPPEEMHVFQRSPSPESAVANWSRGVRGLFSNIGGGNETNEVINGATPEPTNFFSNASHAFTSISSQLPRLSEDVGLIASIARTKLFKGGIVDDKEYQVSANIHLPNELPILLKPCYITLLLLLPECR